MTTGQFRQYLYPENHPRIAELKGLDAYGYREVARRDPFTGGLIRGWTPLYLNGFRGITEDGTLREDVYPWEAARAGEEAPAAAMVEAAQLLLDALDATARDRLCYPVEAPEWQTWANPEFLQFDTGLRLEFQPTLVRDRVMALIEASLSREGYDLVRNMMRINGFLGEVVGLEPILNEFSYNIALYGTPGLRAPWGWQLFGHHCAVNCLVIDGRMSIGPVFLGAEPNEIDQGPRAGTTTLAERIRLGRAVMEALPAAQRGEATLFRQMVDPAMPPDRVHPGDERHVAGAFQDNRVIPFEGIRVAEMPPAARDAARAVLEEFSVLLPPGPRAARMREIDDWLEDTWFSWIGGYGPDEVFYYRIQSPVVIAELDHHCGVFLDYDVPKQFHIHTVLRAPHGNDYGRAWIHARADAHPRPSGPGATGGADADDLAR